MADKAGEAAAGASDDASLKKFSCVLCHKRKVKCDRADPCGYCQRHGDDCVYEAPPPPKRRKKEHKSDHADLLTRLQNAEEQLRRSGLMPPGMRDQYMPVATDVRSRSPPSSTTETKDGRQPSSNEELINRPAHGNFQKLSRAGGRLIKQGSTTRYLDNSLWVQVDNELHNPHELVRNSNEGVTEDVSDEGEVDDAGGMLLGTSRIPDQALADLFPSPAQQAVMWQTYIDNVHYLTMILHKPSFQRVVDQARMSGILSLPKAQAALLFSTYFFAVASLSNAQCEAKLRQPRNQLLKQLRSGTRYALVRASFIRSSDIVTLQAFLQFLLCMRNGYDSQTLWILSGAAFRIAQRMGIHREDADAHISPFECEMRRRLWRQLLILDFTSSELAGSAPGYTVMLGLDSNSSIPLNVNDEDLYPDMKELPEERFGATDMIFCRLRYEFGAFFLYLHRSRQPSSSGSSNNDSWHRLMTDEVSIADKDKVIDELENKLQTQYLRFCDPINRLHNLTTIAARAAITGMKLRSHHPRQYSDGGKSISKEERDLLFDLCVRIMKYDVFCHKQADLQGFLWHIRVYFQWHALIYLLNAMRIRKIGHDIDMAWDLVEEVFQYHPEMMLGGGFALYRAIRSIALRAWDAREVVLRQEGQAIIVPQIITKIRGRLGASGQAKAQINPSPPSQLMTPQSGATNPFPTKPAAAINPDWGNTDPSLMRYGMPEMGPWPQANAMMPGEEGLPAGLMDMPRPGEPSPIDWDAWDTLVKNIDLPTLEFGMDAFFK